MEKNNNVYDVNWVSNKNNNCYNYDYEIIDNCFFSYDVMWGKNRKKQKANTICFCCPSAKYCEYADYGNFNYDEKELKQNTFCFVLKLDKLMKQLYGKVNVNKILDSKDLYTKWIPLIKHMYLSMFGRKLITKRKKGIFYFHDDFYIKYINKDKIGI